MWALARKLLLHDRLRFAVAIAGVSVSVMLVLVQVGLYFGFMDTASSIIDASTADIWVGKAGNDRSSSPRRSTSARTTRSRRSRASSTPIAC